MTTIEQRVEADGWMGCEPILFYSHHDEFGWMSNFSRHQVVLLNPFTNKFVIYPTTEHRYQAMKAIDLEDHDWVNDAKNPTDAKDRGRHIDLRPGWGNDYADLCWYVMMECLYAKVRDNHGLYQNLYGTMGHPLYEDSPTDDIWGVRYMTNYSGKNLLGRCWMEVRGTLFE